MKLKLRRVYIHAYFTVTMFEEGGGCNLSSSCQSSQHSGIQDIIVVQSSAVTTAKVQHALEAERAKMLKLGENFATGRQYGRDASEMSDESASSDSGREMMESAGVFNET